MRAIAVVVLVFVGGTARAQPGAVSDWRTSLATRARSCLAPAGAVSAEELLRGMRALVRLTGDQHWTRAQPAWFLERAVEAQARLLAERAAEAAAVRDGAPKLARRYSAEVAEDRARAVALAEVLRKLGHPDYARALPFAQPERVTLVRATDAAVQVLEARHEPYARLDSGVLIVVSLDELAKRATPILYLSRAEFIADLRNLSEREREREFRRRLRYGATPDAYAAHLLSLDIDQGMLAVALLDRMSAADAQRPAVASFVDGQLARLRTGLAASAAIKTVEAAAQLEDCRRAFGDEAARWSTEARQRGDATLADEIDVLAKSLR